MEVTLGYLEPSGKPFLAFHAESDGTGNTYTTRGKVGRILQSDNSGGLLIGRATNSAASGQTLTTDVIIDNTGNVGIGTTGPGAKLDIQGHADSSAVSTIPANIVARFHDFVVNNPTGIRIETGYSGINPYWDLNVANSYSATYYPNFGPEGALSFSPDGGATAAKVVFTTTGNVGIGTTNPGGGTGSSVLSLYNSSAAPTALANTTHLYSSAGEGYWMDAGGVVTLQTPHDPVTGEWIFLSGNVNTGYTLRVEMERLTKDLDKILGGGYVFETGEPYYQGENLLEKLQKEIEELKLQLDSNGSLAENGSLAQSGEIESPQINGILGDSISFIQKIKEILASLGLFIENGIAKVKELFADRVTVKEIQMVDKATGDIYCTWIEQGEWIKVKGECGDSISISDNTGDTGGDTGDTGDGGDIGDVSDGGTGGDTGDTGDTGCGTGRPDLLRA